MLEKIEHEHLPSLPPLPSKVQKGLRELWENSSQTDTEWVGAVVAGSHDAEADLIILGHQSEGSVTIPIVSVHNFFTLEDVKNEMVDFRQTPDRYKVFYSGKVLFLIPSTVTLNPEICQKIVAGDGLIAPQEYLLGIAHTHPLVDQISHLPSPDDLRHFVFRPLKNSVCDFTISGTSFSCLLKSIATPDYQQDPNWPQYRLNQKLKDNIDLEEYLAEQPEYIAFKNILRANCFKYHLGLFEGNLKGNYPLLPVFKN